MYFYYALSSYLFYYFFLVLRNLNLHVTQYNQPFKVPLRQNFVGLFRPNSVAEYRVVSIFTQKTEEETVHPNIF